MIKLVVFTWLASAFVLFVVATNVCLGALLATDPGIGSGGTSDIVVAAVTGAITALIGATWKVGRLYGRLAEAISVIKDKLDTIERTCAICRNHDPKD